MGGGGDLVRAPGQLIGRAGDLAYPLLDHARG